MITPGFYHIVTLEGGVDSHRGYSEVIETDGPLIKIRHGGEVRILNTAASTFVSATPVDAPPEDGRIAEFL